MTLAVQIPIIAMCIIGTMATRFIPFIAFGGKREIPPMIKYLGTALPAAIFVILVIYSLREVEILTGTHGIPEILALSLTVVSYIWIKNMLLSIAAGTIAYMLLVQTLF